MAEISKTTVWYTGLTGGDPIAYIGEEEVHIGENLTVGPILHSEGKTEIIGRYNYSKELPNRGLLVRVDFTDVASDFYRVTL